MPVQYDASKENWWLSVGGFVVGDTHRSLTNKLLHDGWLACQVLQSARMASQHERGYWIKTEVQFVKNGEPFGSPDVI